jgi:hypothetical protein
MSWSERCVQDHRRQTDRAIHRVCGHLAFDPPTLTKFLELLICARRRAPRLFEAPVTDGRHLGVEALLHLARFRDEHIRSAADWAGISSSWRPAISSLAQHLICRYHVPGFMASVWHAGDEAGDRKRSWMIAHSRGASFRSLDLPISITRKMERIFLASQDHLAVEAALRRAELLAFGVPAEFIQSIMLTRLATDLRNGDFWRTFWMFLVTHAGKMDAGQIGPMIDYIQSVRHDCIRIETQNGMAEVFPPQPAFSMKGRTVTSLLRLMKEWHRHLGNHGGSTFSWARSSFKPWLFEEPALDDAKLPRRWHMMELTNSAQLREEGVALHHCVGSYAHVCHRGSSSIWSLRVWRGEQIRSVLTVEIDPKRRAVIQARGKANGSASGKLLNILHHWATREGLQMAI